MKPGIVFGIAAYGLASLLLLVCLGAAYSRVKTGKFSSGVHFVPTIAALLGSLDGITWKAFFVVLVLDLGSMFAGSKAQRPPIPPK